MRLLLLRCTCNWYHSCHHSAPVAYESCLVTRIHEPLVIDTSFLALAASRARAAVTVHLSRPTMLQRRLGRLELSAPAASSGLSGDFLLHDDFFLSAPMFRRCCISRRSGGKHDSVPRALRIDAASGGAKSAPRIQRAEGDNIRVDRRGEGKRGVFRFSSSERQRPLAYFL